jgi:ATP-binding cassette, subfamily B, bacterial
MEDKKLPYKDRLKTLKLILKWSFKASPAIFIGIIILTVVSGSLVVAIPYVYKILIDFLTNLDLQTTTTVTLTIILITLLYTSIVFSTYLFNEINYLLRMKTSLRIEKYISKKLMEKTTSLDLEYFEDSEFYDNLYKANQSIPRFPGTLRDFITVLRFFVSVLVILVTLIIYDFKLAILVLIGTIPGLIISLRYVNINYQIFSKNSKEKRKAKYYLNLINADRKSVKEIKLFSLKNTFIKKFEDLFKIAIKRQDKAINKHILYITLSILFNLFVVFLGLLLITNMYITLAITIGTVVFLFALLIDFSYNINILFELFGYLNQGISETNSLTEITEYKTKMKNFSKGDAFPKMFKKGIIFKDVYFKYPRTKKYVLDKINFTIKPGENLAIVGENGSGKTTFIKLLTRLYDTTKGDILIENKNIKEYKLSEVHKNIGVIFQDFVQYETTVKENIQFGNVNKSRKYIHNSAVSSGAYDFIRNFDKKYDENLGRMIEKDGKELSGGEWQKIALARAFFKDSQILILDEPTAAIDAKAEYQLFKRFKKLTKNKTTILISHRFSTVRIADRIIVMHKGKIIEEGNHEKLMEKKGHYFKLFSLQAKSYK